MEEEIKQKRHYKVEAGDKIVLKRQEHGDYVFFKVSLKTKNADGTESAFDKNIAFPKDTDITNLQNGTMILVKDFYEYGVPIKNNKYVTNWSLYIKDWEIVNENVFEEYNKANSEFDFNELDNSDLPF